MSSLVWSPIQQRWEILDLRTDQVIATKAGSEEYPLGVHQWQFENKSCHDLYEPLKTIKLHLAVEEPGKFCCSDGLCIPSELVCDNVQHCQAEFYIPCRGQIQDMTPATELPSI